LKEVCFSILTFVHLRAVHLIVRWAIRRNALTDIEQRTARANALDELLPAADTQTKPLSKRRDV